MRVCEQCLRAIKSREGDLEVVVRNADTEGTQCSWCGDLIFDTVYELKGE